MPASAVEARPEAAETPGANVSALREFIRGFWSSEALLVAAVACVTFANMWAYYHYNLVSLALVMTPIPLCALAMVAPRRPANLLVWAGAVAACAVGIGLHWTRWTWTAELAVLAVAAVVLARWRIGWLAVLGVLALQGRILVGSWTWGFLDFDVFRLVQSGAGALLHGGDPYGPVAPTFVQDRGFVPVHFPYGPSVAVMALPGRALGDVRASGLFFAFVAVASVTLWSALRRGPRRDTIRVAAIAGALGFTSVVILLSWVEVYTLGLFGLWVVLRRRLRPLAVVALALCLLTKPTIAPVLVPLFLWSRRARWEIVWSAVLAAVFAVPFALRTGLHQFYEDVAGVHLHLFPVRVDALTVNALLHSIGRPFFPTSLAVVVIAAVIVAIALRRPRDAGDMFAAGALLTVVVLLCAKEAFMNYYYAVAVLLVFAVAGRGMQLDVEPPRLPDLGALRRRPRA